jgi:hypothetical protein
VQQPFDAGGAARRDHLAGQIHVHRLKGRPRTPALVEDAHQVDHRVAAVEVPLQEPGLMDIGIDHVHRGQDEDVAVPFAAPGQYLQAMPGRGQMMQ